MAPPIVTRFLISLNEHKWLGTIIFVVITGGSFLFTLAPEPEPPQDQILAFGRLSFTRPGSTFTVAGEQLTTEGRATRIQDLMSEQVIETIANRLDYNLRQTERVVADLILGLPEEDLNQARRGNTVPLITFRYDGGRTPEESRRVLQVFMEEVVNESYRINTIRLQNRIGDLERRLDNVRGDLREAEQNYYTYISNEGALLLSVQDGSLFGGITSSEQQKRQLDVLLSGIDGEIRTLQEQLQLTPEEAYVSSALSADPIIANLRALILQNDLELERLQRDLRDDHPTMVELRQQKALNERLLEERGREVIGTDRVFQPLTRNVRDASNLDQTRAQLAARLINLQGQRNAVAEQLNAVEAVENTLRQEYEQFPERQTQQTSLIQQVQAQRVLYETIFAALIDARSAEVEADSSFTIVQPAFLVREPSPPVAPGTNPIIIVGIGMVIGFASAMGVIFLFATLDERLHTPRELRDFFGERDVPLLAELPMVQNPEPFRKSMPIIFEPDSPFARFYERLRSNIRRLGGENAKVILISSVIADEGRTVTAYNLAIASANAGKRTLLVELDLRDKNPGSRKYFQLQPDPALSSNPVSYYDFQGVSNGDLSSLIQRVPEIPNFSVVPSPGFQQQAPAILESSEIKSFLRYARAQYDFVVIDTPSLSSCNDALLLEPFVDGIVLVTHPGKSLRNLLGTTIDDFIEEELPLVGGVINNVNFEGSLLETEDDESSIFMGDDGDDTSSIFQSSVNSQEDDFSDQSFN
ncbi:lipopolysaccharide biosynthesis protein [Cyanobacterium stanieri PCC 7202]|uniref:Lipopolysaccharide biosynthesis protein n=1 Tax=Cyanobacterium stanieri (strain ATCC 29140 / PCC 7202) TaxID=292563 RepID=K9YNT7_CYASC|nr:lipopolysaccharide biosynthesis protein [Cyanobacterium stanieri PCC 7202]